MPASKYDQYAESGSGGSFDDVTLKVTPHTTFRGDLDRVFGNGNSNGQSLGIAFENTAVVDGGLYYDEDKPDTYKLFSWTEITGFDVYEQVEQGDEPHASDAREVLPKTYGSDTEKRYHLVAARIPNIVDEDGEVLVEASSVVMEDDEMVDTGGDLYEFGDSIMWQDGSSQYGASASGLRLAELLTMFGEGAIVDSDDIHNWLADVSGDNILRDDLRGRTVDYILTQRTGDDSGRAYHYPVLEDVQTGEQIVRSNAGDSGNPNRGSDAQGSGSDAETDDESGENAGGGGVNFDDAPDPVNDFRNSANSLQNLDRERANALLDDVLESDRTQLTEDMVAAVGGRDALIGAVTE